MLHGNARQHKARLLESMPKRYQDMARAAIKAMREPTEAMVDQGYSYCDEDALVARRPPTGRGRLFFAWQAMIDSGAMGRRGRKRGQYARARPRSYKCKLFW